jgi:hypothetical protein
LKLWSGPFGPGRPEEGLRLFGYALAALARPLLGVIVAPWQLFVIRIGDRIGKGVRTSPRDALIADSTDPSMRGRAFGFHRAMDHLGAAVGPLLAAGFLWLWPDHLRTLFLLTLLPGLLVVVLLVFGLREARPQPPRRLRNAPAVRLQPGLYLLALVVFTLGNPVTPSSWWWELMSHGALAGAWCIHVVKSSGNLILGRGVDRYDWPFCSWAGWLRRRLPGLRPSDDGLGSLVFFLSYALFYGLTEPAEDAARTSRAAAKGLAYGWYNFAIGVTTLRRA